jgi:hypothetical protein
MNWNFKIDILIEITRINIFTQAGCLTTVLQRISGLKGGSERRWGK